MKTNIPITAEVLAEHLLKLPANKQEELFAQWTWQTAVFENQKRLTIQSTVISGLSGILGGVLGVVATLLTQHYLK